MCPCDASVAISTPLFIGKDYFCVSGINVPWDSSPTYSIQMILYGMEVAVFPAAPDAHNKIHHISLSKCQPQPLMTLRPGSFGIMDSNSRTS